MSRNLLRIASITSQGVAVTGGLASTGHDRRGTAVVGRGTMNWRTSIGLATLAAALVVGMVSSTDSGPAYAERSQPARSVTVPGSFTGYAFDACHAPTQATMNT